MEIFNEFNLGANVVSPDQSLVITFGEMQEQSMGGAYYAPIYVQDRESGVPFLLHSRSVGNAVWRGNTCIYFPIWMRNAEDFLMQQIAVYDLKGSTLTVYEKVYQFVLIQAIKGNLMTALDSPYWHPKQLLIDLKCEKVEKTMIWTQNDARLLEIGARVRNASSGNWASVIEGRDQTSGSSFIMTGVKNSDDVKNLDRGEDIYLTGATMHDFDFIAHARQDIPYLLAEIERLKRK
jgi:hypothetical protein